MHRNKSVRLPSLPSLRAFEAVARLSSVKDAADEMHLTPSAVSHQLRNLEDDLGVTLFKRRNQAIELTDAGALFATFAERGFRELRQGVAALRTETNRGILYVSVAPLFAMEILIPALPEFERLCPNVEVRLDVGESLADFDGEFLDVAIRVGTHVPTGLDSEPLLDVCLAPVCAPNLLDGPFAIRKPEDMQAHARLVTDEPGDHDGWDLWLGAAGIAGLRPSTEMHFDTFLGTVRAAEAGLGVAMAPLSILARHIAERRLIAPFGTSVASPWSYRFVCRRGQMHQLKIRQFRDWLNHTCLAHTRLASLPCMDRARARTDEAAIALG